MKSTTEDTITVTFDDSLSPLLNKLILRKNNKMAQSVHSKMQNTKRSKANAL